MYPWYSIVALVLFSVVGSLLLMRPIFKRKVSRWPVLIVLGIAAGLFFVSTKLGWLMIAALVIESVAWFQLLKYLLRQSIVAQMRNAMGIRINYRPGMSEDEFQRMIGPVVKGAPEEAGVLLFRRVHYCAEHGLPIARQNIRRLHRMKKLNPVDTRDHELFPKAKFVLRASWSRVYFSSNLSYVGYRDFAPEVSAIVSDILDEHCLRPEDCDFLLWLNRLNQCDADMNGLYGGPGRPFPVQRWHMYWTMDGSRLSLYFDEAHKLIVAYSEVERVETVLWERPNARQPELYKKIS